MQSYDSHFETGKLLMLSMLSLTHSSVLCSQRGEDDDDEDEGWTESETDSDSDDDAPTDYTNMAAYFLKDK